MENSNFRLKAVAELLDGNHSFYIPSYQRGYRWDEKQVEDLFSLLLLKKTKIIIDGL
jgi:uncharacterized protein with ParB-like and HNH nuclease domain